MSNYTVKMYVLYYRIVSIILFIYFLFDHKLC